MFGKKARPNTALLDILVKPCILELQEEPLKYDNSSKVVFSQYISDLLPHYLGLLTTYLLTLKNQTQYTFEDIDVFANII